MPSFAPRTLASLAAELGGDVDEGARDVVVDRLVPTRGAPKGSLAPLFDRRFLAAARASEAMLLVTPELAPLVPEGMDLPELALRFILHHPAVSTTIPGMRRPQHVERNISVSDGEPLPPRLVEALGAHRWDRVSNVA